MDDAKSVREVGGYGGNNDRQYSGVNLYILDLKMVPISSMTLDINSERRGE